MLAVNWSDFKITPILDTVHRLNISDAEYFGPLYRDYISNSKLKLINPDQDGSPMAFKEGLMQESTPSLAMGSAVHQLFLQPDEFRLVEGLSKPSAKLGLVVDKVKEYRKQEYSILNALKASSQDIGYYVNALSEKRINDAIQKGYKYYLGSRNLSSDCIVLSDKETETLHKCLNSLNVNNKALNLIRSDEFKESYNEDAMFVDIKVTYKDEQEIILKLKMKADNWTVDTFNREVVLNDLKTTGKPVPFFMKEYGSFFHFHYARQMAMYSWILKLYCMKEYGMEDDWNLNSNMIVVETIPPHRSQCYGVSKELLHAGAKELFYCLKRVAFHEMFGYDTEVIFS